MEVVVRIYVDIPIRIDDKFKAISDSNHTFNSNSLLDECKKATMQALPRSVNLNYFTPHLDRIVNSSTNRILY